VGTGVGSSGVVCSSSLSQATNMADMIAAKKKNRFIVGKFLLINNCKDMQYFSDAPNFIDIFMPNCEFMRLNVRRLCREGTGRGFVFSKKIVNFGITMMQHDGNTVARTFLNIKRRDEFHA